MWRTGLSTNKVAFACVWGWQRGQERGTVAIFGHCTDWFIRKDKSIVLSPLPLPKWESLILNVAASSTLGASLYSRTQLEELESKGSLSQTRVVLYVQLDIKGSGLTNEYLTRRLGQLSNLRNYFARDLLFDAEERKVFASRADIDKDVAYTGTETGVLEKGTELKEKFRLLPRNVKSKARSNSPLVDFEVATGMKGFGKATTNINAPMTDVLAFTVNTKARNQLKKRREEISFPP